MAVMSQATAPQRMEIDVDTPNAARMYDYALGGSHNFAADRAAYEELLRMVPNASLVGHTNRMFLQRAVSYCCDQGVSQFLDLGSGIPTVGNVHLVAHERDPECRVVYVDIDPIAVVHTRQLLSGVRNAAMVHADMRDVDAVLGAPETRLLDFSKPVAVMMVAVLHYVSPEDDVAGIVSRYKAALAPGSLLVVSHLTWEDQPPEETEAAKKVLKETSTPVTYRTRTEVTALFDGMELVPPGVVWTPRWKPADETELFYETPELSATYAAVGRIT